MEDMIKAGHAFHELPVEEKMKYHTEDKQKSRYSPNTLDKTKNKTVNWVDFFLMFSHLGFENFDEWPDVCREPGMEYCRGLRKMAERICGALSEGLGLPADYVQKAGLIDRQMLSLNYYPRCPDPNLALGVRDHSDPGTITILLQDQVAALQVSKEGRWVSVEPLVNAFVVNVGDQMEILSNGRFRSAEHRAVLTEVKVSRLSLPTFFNPRLEAKVTPILWHVDGEKKKSYYKECVFGDYLSNFFGKEYDSKSALEFVRLP